MTQRRPITAEDRRRAVEAALRRRWPDRVIRITEGMRRAILAGKAHRRPTDDAGEWAWP